MQHIETDAEPLLAAADEQADDETYWSLLTLYQQISDDHAKRLAKRAMANADEDVRDAGETILRSYGEL